MSSWNTPNYQGVNGRWLSPAGVKEVGCHYSIGYILEQLLKVSTPTDLDKIKADVERLVSEQPENLAVLEQIKELPLMWGQNGFASKFVKFANGGFQIDFAGGLPGGDWDTLNFPSTSSYGPYPITGIDIASTQVLVFVNGNKLNNLMYEVTNDGTNTNVQINPSYSLPANSCIEILYRRNVVVDTDTKVKTSATDATHGYLFNKIQTSGFLKPVSIVSSLGNELVEIGTKFDIPTPTVADAGKIFGVDAYGNVMLTGDIGSVFSLIDNQTTPVSKVVNNGEKIQYASNDLDFVLTEPSVGTNQIAVNLKNTAEMFKMRDADSTISVLNSDNIKLMSTDSSINIDLDTANKVFDFKILNLLPTLKLGTITDNVNQFGAPSNNTVQYNAQSNIKYTSSNSSVKVSATTSGTPDFTTDTLDITVDETPGVLFTGSSASAFSGVVGSWTALSPGSYNTDIFGATIQVAGSFQYKATKSGKVLVNYSVQFDDIAIGANSQKGIRVKSNGNIVAQAYEINDSANDVIVHKTLNISKIIRVSTNDIITVEYFTGSASNISLLPPETYFDINYMN